jgi:exodeoxyribonuclease VII large subunit
MKQKALTLYELNCMVRDLIDLDMPDSYWVQAELSQIREVNHNCYMELIQKENSSNTPVARASAKCWRSTWLLLKPCLRENYQSNFALWDTSAFAGSCTVS